MTGSNLHLGWSRLFLRALAASGVTDVVISPGSRSTPVALTAGETPGLTCHVVVDERSAAFFALGQARVTGRPSVLVCTSGTAGAHYLPAVIEASQAHVPMILVTADRPWEAQHCAAPQTVDQADLFGRYVRHRAELGLPDPSPGALRAVPRIAAQAVHLARRPVPGPVHVNARFRKPLEPVDVTGPEPWETEIAALVDRGAPRVYAPRSVPDPDGVHALAAACEGTSRGLIVCGPAVDTGDGSALRAAAVALARATGFPLLPEATSGVRFGAATDGATVCGGFDTFLRDEDFRRGHAPEVVVEIGAPPTSSAWAQYLALHPRALRFVVAPYGWSDPAGDATALVLADPAVVCAAVAARLVAGGGSPSETMWSRDFARAEAVARTLVDREIAEGALTEGTVARRLVSALPAGAVLVVGNSMPVRDLDTYAPVGSVPVWVLHQRGASGIDGLVSGAAGARSVTAAPVVLYLGDLSMQHDLGGLAAARGARGPLVVVVVQNDGGRIFEQLPLARRPEVGAAFERYFTTPQGLDFTHAAALFGHGYARVGSVAAFDVALARALATDGCTVVEAVVPPRDATARRARIYRDVARSGT